MAELKHTFTLGRMNKDLDERLVKNGEYIDAQNIQVSSSEGSDVGAIENVLGNDRLSKLKLTNAKTLGSIAYNLKNKIYWIVTSNEIDGIYEYDETQRVVSPVLIDKKLTKEISLKGAIVYSNIDNELIIENYNDSTLKELIGNDLPLEIDEEKLVKNNISIISYDPYIKISIPKNTTVKKNTNEKLEFKNIEYNGKKYGNIDIKAIYTSDGVLNFSKNNLITGINIVDDLLFWTDNLNQPRRINISSFKKYSDNIFDQDTQVEYAEKDPTTKKVIKLKRNFTEDDISVIKKSPMYAPTMELYDSVTDGIVDIKYSLDFSDVYIGKIFTLDNITDFPSWNPGDFVTIQSDDADFILDASVKSTDDSIVELSVSTISGDFDNQSYDCNINLKQKKALYELNFVRFAYRWKYKNGEYSTLSPFTEPAFIADDFKYDGKEAFNYGMINKLQRVILNSFDLGNDDISEIDILLKEGRNQNVYVLKTIKKLDFTNEYIITKEQIHSVIPNDQILRAWDNVPKRAKAQEVTANRVIYGNYTQNYDVYNEPDIKVSTVARQDELNRTIKSNRSYQIGVAYIDEYNRHTPVLSNDTGAFNITKDNSTLKNQFSLSLNNKPPAWAKYFKYYIKDTAGEYYNLSADKFYKDVENGFTYISFPSSDRSKVTNDHYLILKKKHGDNVAVLDKDNRYKIIDIFSDPPEFITNRKKAVISLGDIIFTDDYAGSGGGTTVTNKTDAEESAPLQDYAVVQIKEANSSADGVALDDAKEIKPGRFITFEYLGKESKAYKIKRLSQHPSGNNEIKIEFDEPFGDDVEIIYNKTTGNIGDATTNFGVNINILEEYSAAGDKEFDGRFFIKLKTNSVLENSIVTETVGGVSYLAKKSIPLIGVYSKNDDNGTGRRGENSWKNINRIKDNASKDPKNKYVVSDGGTITPGNTPETGKRVVKGSLQYNITLESATENLHDAIDSLAKTAKAGNFVRFVNADGTPHHDTIYEIGSISTDKYDTNYGSTGLWRAKGSIKRIHFRFIDENGEFKPLDADVVKRGDDTWGNEPQMEILQELDEENIIIKDPAIFETEPLEQKTELDIYYETEKAIPIDEHGQTHTLNWYNAISFGNGVESNRIRDDFNAIFIDTGVKASTVLAEPFKEEHKFNGIIWSGIINSRSGTNQSNQFNMANAITKDLLPSYGSVQKLFARDGDIVIYCEDKIVRALADKDILYNADGSANVTASNRVIGNVIPFAGEYGISQNPESFAYYGFRAYHADPKRGVVIRLSQDGLTPISSANMSTYFRSTLYGRTGEIIGSYDHRNKLYNLSYGSNTVCFSEDVNGWTTFKSFLPQNGISLNNIYYTYNSGDLWAHDSTDVPYNNFYGNQYASTVQLNINDNPSVVKKYKTLGYEGSTGWKAIVSTDQQSSSELSFKEKENKYFVNISGESKDINTLDTKNFSTQGIGRSIKKTTITFADGDVVVGQNGEIIILGGGNISIGPDYIITGDNIDYDINDNGDIIVTGDNIGGGSGTGDTTGGDTVGTGGGTVEVNDTGGSGSDGSGGDGTGDFTDTGGDGVGVDSEDDYTDQLGDTSNTTATFALAINGKFYSKEKQIINKPGENISQVVFTIYPNQGYNIFASDFYSSENISFKQDGNNVKATLTLNIAQPDSDQTYYYVISGKAELKPISISGNIDIDLTNATIDKEDISTYNLSGDYGEEKIITERIITASSGYYLTADSISVDNNSVFIEKLQLSDTSFKIVETVFIPKNTTTNNNYTITVEALEVVLPDPKIVSKTLDTTTISNLGETRTLTVNGQKDARFEVIISDTSGVISTQTYTLDITGKKDIPIILDAGDTAETYTVKINSLTGTDVDNAFGAQTITLTRNAKGRKSASFLVNYSNSINNNFILEDYIGQSTSRQFSFDLTLPSGTYTIGKQPTSSDITFGDNENNAFVVLNDISFDAVNTNILTVSGTLFVSEFVEDEVYSLDVSSFVGKDVTTTFNYTTPTSEYTVGATSYTVDGGAGLNTTPDVDEYFFTLTPASTYSFKTDIDADNFELIDSGNNDVVADYALNGEILLRKVGDTLEVGFKTKTFVQPSASSTFTVRPKTGVVLTEAESLTIVTSFYVNADIYTSVDDITPVSPDQQTRKLLKYIEASDDYLVQIQKTITSDLFDTNEFTDNSLFYIDNTNNSHITLATAGTYGSTTITGPFEASYDKKTLTINLLVNLGGDTTLTSGDVKIYINKVTDKVLDSDGNISDKYYLVEVKLAGCGEQVNGPKENDRSWSPIDESSNVYPKYYATSDTLSEDVRIFERISSAQPIPGNTFGFTAADLIQKGNEKLFTVSSKNTLSGFQAGWLFEKSICNLDGSHIKLYNNTKKHLLYPDIIKYSYPISSTIFRNEKQTITGTVKIDNRANYDAIVQDIADKGLTIKPIQKVAVNTNTLTFEYAAYFDNNGNSTFDFDVLRGSGEYNLTFSFDDVTSDSLLSKLSGKSYDMRRRSYEDKDNNDHIPQDEIDDYVVYDDYNTGDELDRYDDDSGDYDGGSTRDTDNTPTGGGDTGYSGNASDINNIPDDIVTQEDIVEYLNGSSVNTIFASGYQWTRKGNFVYEYFDSAAGPLSGNVRYLKTGFIVTLSQPTAISGNLPNFIDTWEKINNGEITSFKIPLDIFNPGTGNIDPVRTPGIRFKSTTIDPDGGWPVLEEKGYYTRGRMDWINYYIGQNNIYISETVRDGLVALPNYSGIEFTFGVTVPYDTFDGVRGGHTIFARIPFEMGSFIATRVNDNRINSAGQSWNYISQDAVYKRYGTLTQYPAAYGIMRTNNNNATYGKTIKFRAI